MAKETTPDIPAEITLLTGIKSNEDNSTMKVNIKINHHIGFNKSSIGLLDFKSSKTLTLSVQLLVGKPDKTRFQGGFALFKAAKARRAARRLFVIGKLRCRRRDLNTRHPGVEEPSTPIPSI